MNHENMRRFLRDIYMQNLAETQMREFFERIDIPEDPHELEHDPQIKTCLTDKDMLLLHIDMALDSGDVESFMKLTKELKRIEEVKSK